MKVTSPKDHYDILVVLGSGGHTNEILRICDQFEKIKKFNLVFIKGESDELSSEKIQKRETISELISIPRPRSVGQSYFTSLFTTFYSLWISILLFRKISTDMILVNGPGISAIVVIASYIYHFIMFKENRPKIVYIESFARVYSLSLTGRIMEYLADCFLVQWPQLQYPPFNSPSSKLLFPSSKSHQNDNKNEMNQKDKKGNEKRLFRVSREYLGLLV